MTQIDVLSGAVADYAEDAGNPNNTASLTAGRYYPERLPNDPVYPSVVVSEVSSSPDVMAHDTTRVLTAIRVQFDVYAATKAEAAEIGGLLFSSFSPLQNATIGSGLPNGGVLVKSAFRQFKQFIPEDDLDRWRYLQDFIFNV